MNDKKTGLFTDISFEEYCSIEAVNNSSLNDFDRSPAHYYERHVSPNREPRVETPSMFFGTAIHTAVLEIDRFNQTYNVKPEPEFYPDALNLAADYKEKCAELGLKTSGTKEEMKARILGFNPNIQFFDDIEKKLASKFKLLSKDQFDSCHAIAKRIRTSPSAQMLFSGGQPEVTMLWVDQWTGLYCKARMDYLAEVDGAKIIVDLKSTDDARSREFARTSVPVYNYHRQAAHYANGIETLGFKFGLFAFAVFERVPPYAASFPYASDAMIAAGRNELSVLMKRLMECKRDSKWPAYDESLVPIDLPKWKTADKELEVF